MRELLLLHVIFVEVELAPLLHPRHPLTLHTKDFFWMSVEGARLNGTILPPGEERTVRILGDLYGC